MWPTPRGTRSARAGSYGARLPAGRRGDAVVRTSLPAAPTASDNASRAQVGITRRSAYCALCRYRHKAHLARDLTAHSEGLGAQKQFGATGLEIAGRLFAAWGEFREDADRARLLESVAPLREELRALLEEAARNRRHRTFAKNLLKRWPALWTFTTVPGVEPTNNHAERGLRGAVIYRKLSLGSQSEEGERTIERLLSASVTCRLQRRSLFAYLSDVLAAKIRGDPVPLLSRFSGGPTERLRFPESPALASDAAQGRASPCRCLQIVQILNMVHWRGRVQESTGRYQPSSRGMRPAEELPR